MWPGWLKCAKYTSDGFVPVLVRPNQTLIVIGALTRNDTICAMYAGETQASVDPVSPDCSEQWLWLFGSEFLCAANAKRLQTC
jgi:hypothetical protein